MQNPALPSAWQIVYRGTGDTSDGFVESPYFLTGFDDDRYYWPVGLNVTDTTPAVSPDDDDPYQLGTERLFTPTGSVMEILPLFSVDSATALIQLWGFDVQDRQSFVDSGIDNESPEPRIILDIHGAKTNNVLGEAYNIARDDPGSPRSIPVAAKEDIQTILAGLVHGDLLQRDLNGETFAVGAKHIFEVNHGAFMVNVPVLSAGELILAVRFRSDS